jgi:hypothetical protein
MLRNAKVLMKRTKPSSKIKDRLPRISLYPLTPEEAISALMKVDPKRVVKAERKAKENR